MVASRDGIGQGWILFALVAGLTFQYFQFFRNETRSMVQEMIQNNPTLSGQPNPGIIEIIENQPKEPQVGEEQLPHVDISGPPPKNPDAAEPEEEQEEAPEMNIPVAIPIVGNFDPKTFDYKQPALRTNYTLPPPRLTNQSTVVIVLSARYNFEQRAVIRETWAKDNDNVYFIVGGPVPSDVQDMDRSNPLSTSTLLFQEQQNFGDIIDVIHPDTYKSLPYKLHFSVRWIMKNLRNVNWIVKADDDQLVRVKLLQYFVLRQMNPNHPLVIGTIAVGGRPHKHGKWAEDPHFTDLVYPPWPFGSAGYVISRPVAQYLANSKLYYYQGEDAGLGIWLSQSPLQVTFIDTPELRKDEGCQNKLYVIGHDYGVDAIRDCWRQLGDNVPRRPYIIAFTAARKDQFPHMIRNPS